MPLPRFLSTRSRRPRRAVLPGVRPSADRITFLMFNANGTGGVARTALNLANHLAADGRAVEVVSVYRRRLESPFTIDPRVKVTYLVDAHETPGRIGAALAERPTRLTPRTAETNLSRRTDLLLRRALWSRPPGVVISTRPSLHLAAAQLSPPWHVLIGQDHLNFESRMANRRQVPVLESALHSLDSFTVLTEADAQDYRATFPEATARIEVIRNASSFEVTPPGPQVSRIVIAAGRLVQQKAFPRLVEAYAPVADKRPDWQLHIYGSGEHKARLERQIADLGVAGQVRLMGHTTAFEERLAEASVYAMSSRYEGFPMVLVEAMSKGVPAIAYDCPRGPAEIIHDGVNGRLIPDGDVAAYTAALLAMIDEDDVRREMAWAAHAQAEQYTMARIGEQWENLIAELVTDRRRRA